MNGRTPTAVDLDPKAVTNDELFGIINPSTREWKDGEVMVLLNVAICLPEEYIFAKFSISRYANN